VQFAIDTLCETRNASQIMKSKRAYRSLHEYLDRTGTQQQVLARRARMPESLLSMILRGSRRCSLENALRLAELTGVPVERLTKWPRVHKVETSGTAA
jgi:transcriptional regulator with XRE-family HTH domain